MIEKVEVRPDWGHALLTPEGEEIRVPRFAFEGLRRLGLLSKGRAQLRSEVYGFLDPEFDTLTDGLRKLLGADLSGPAWLVCHCRECQNRDAETDHTQEPRGIKSAMIAEEAVRAVRRRRSAR